MTASPQFVRPFRRGNGGDFIERARLVTGAEVMAGVEELFTPTPVVGDNDIKLAAATQQDHAFVEDFAWAETLRVLQRDLAEQPAPDALTKDFHHPVKVPRHDREPFVEGRFR